jgi:hypothetical protein
LLETRNVSEATNRCWDCKLREKVYKTTFNCSIFPKHPEVLSNGRMCPPLFPRACGQFEPKKEEHIEKITNIKMQGQIEERDTDEEFS